MISCSTSVKITQHLENFGQLAARRHFVQVVRSAAIVVFTSAALGCGAGGTSGSSGTAIPAGENNASATACSSLIQQGLAAHGTPDEIRENSITFEDGTIMLIEEHIYLETRLVRSFGHEVESSDCSSWEEGLTI